MKYQNTKTGFILDTDCEIKAEGWVKLDPQPSPRKKPNRKKKVDKDADLRND